MAAKRFYFGVDYYPEHWPEARWAVDARLMADAGFNLVRMAEFAWSKMEPQAGHFEFAWLDRALSALEDHGIKAVLGTPTASPPPWLMAQDDGLFRVLPDGRRMTYGSRREYCPNNPLYHKHSLNIVNRMAEHYGDHPAVIGWQIDNEFGDRCYCDICRRAFQEWLSGKYASLEELNQRWGTVFWGHTYNDWSQIPVPLETGAPPNPGLALDFFRFASDSYRSFQKAQVDALRDKCPDQFITHNLMGFHYGLLDYFDLAEDLDFVSWDVYHRTQWSMEAQTRPSWAALGHDTMRGLKSRNYWVMEQQAGPGGWVLVSVAPKPGELRLWAYQSIAHGADAVVFFRWRTARFGAEEYWHGVLDHHGVPGRRYAELKDMGAEIKRLGDRILGSEVQSSVAMVLSYDARFAFQIQPNNPRFDYPEHLHDLYRALHERNVAVDIVSPSSDLSSYKLVLAPALHVVTEDIAANLQAYVKGGGVLVVTPRTGVKEESNAVVDVPLPGLLGDLFGVEVEEYISMPVEETCEIELALPGQEPVRTAAWPLCDVLRPREAEIVARYTQDFFAGKPAVSLNHFGKGQAVYLGATGGVDLYARVADWLLELAGVRPLLETPKGVEVCERVADGGRLLFILNHTTCEQTIELGSGYVDLLGGSERIEGRMRLPAHGIVILAQEMR